MIRFIMTGAATKSPIKLSPSLTHAAPCNVTAALVADMFGIGLFELVLGLNDGSLHLIDFGHDMEQSHCSSGDPGVHDRIVWQASAAITSLATVQQGSSMYLVMGLETGTIEVLDCRAFGPEGEAMGAGSWLVDLDVGGGLPLPSCGWSGPAVCCSAGETGTT